MMRIGILELTCLPGLTTAGKVWAATFGPRYASIMPQAAAVWFQAAGHEVDYRIYSGCGSLAKRIPTNVDVLFLVATSRTVGLAEKVAKSVRGNRRPRIIACGAHASGNPEEMLRWADSAIVSCNRDSLLAFVEDGNGGLVLDKSFILQQLPLLRSRAALVRSQFPRSPKWMQMVPLMHSVGCPHRCSFCRDHDRKYESVGEREIEDDLFTASAMFPHALVAFHDPNWGMARKRKLRMIGRRRRQNRYIVEMELQHFDAEVLELMRAANVCFVAPGIESFCHFDDKVGSGTTGKGRKDYVVNRLWEIQRYVKLVQANMLIGFDWDTDETWELTRELIREAPWAWCNLAPVYPFPGTPLRRQMEDEGRMLDVPSELYCAPFLVHRLTQWPASEFYRRLLEVYRLQVRTAMLASLICSASRAFGIAIRLPFVMESCWILRQILKEAAAVDRFHARRGPLPEVYRRLSERWRAVT